MLSIGKLTAGREEYYLSLAAGQDDYYLDPTEPAGQWIGSLSAALGLHGTVQADQFRAVLSARHPHDGSALIRDPDRPGRVTGFDLTFSAPKSVSLLWALSDPETSAAVSEAHDLAVADAITALEGEAVRARRGHAGARVVHTDGLAAAAFGHRTSRAGDPQLHTHVVAANLTRGSDRGWSTLFGRPIYSWAKTTGYLYQAALRARLTETLGVEWGPVRRGVAEIAGVTPTQIEAFSTRRTQVTTELGRLGLSSVRAARTATLATRTAKDHGHSLTQLRARWAERAELLGLDPAGLTGPPRHAGHDTDLVERLLSPEGLTANSASFDRRTLLQSLAAGHPDGATPTAIRSQADALLARPEIVTLDTPTPSYSTTELVATERRLVDRAVRRLHDDLDNVPPAALRTALDQRPTLTGEQRDMVSRLTTSGAGVQVVVGRAGTGKTFALDAARSAWETAGHRVIGAALAARAAAELQAGSGIPSQTVDRLLAELDTPGPLSGLAPRTVLVIDEAGMIGTRKLGRLLDHAQHHQARVVLVGDPRQMPEIEAGGAFAALASHLDAIELTANRRQEQQWERDALDQLRSGSVAKAVTAYVDQHRVTLAPDAESVHQTLVDDWWAATADGTRTTAMYALRRRDVDDLNHRARAHLRAADFLEEPDVHIAGRPFAKGDRVLCLRNDRRLGVRNGTTATLADIETDRAVIALADGTEITLPGDYLDAGHLTHGYATTIHKAQGATVDYAFLLGSDQLYREAGYVGLSRARTETHLYMVGPTRNATQEIDSDTVTELTAALRASNAQTLAASQLPDRNQDLAAALLADPPAWAVDALGSPPTTGPQRERWCRDATFIARYRHDHHIGDPDHAIGPEPPDPAARRRWSMARHAADRHRPVEPEKGLTL